MLTPEEEWEEGRFELWEEIKYLKGQITYLQEELAMTEDALGRAEARIEWLERDPDEQV